MKRIFCLAIVSLIAAVPVSAAPTMKPGLWNVTTKMNMGQAMMPKLTPQQMEMMKRMNVKVPTVSEDGVTTQVCVTAKDQSDAMAYAQTARKENGCKAQNIKNLGLSSSADIVCTGEMKGQGRASMNYKNDREYVGSFAFKGTSKGRAVDMKSTYAGKFIKADCGKVKSFSQQ